MNEVKSHSPLDLPLQIFHDFPDPPFWGLTYGKTSEELIIPLFEQQQTNSHSELDFGDCIHDVVAVHVNALPSSGHRVRKIEDLEFLQDKISSYINKIIEKYRLNEEGKFVIVYFTDLDDLNVKIQSLRPEQSDIDPHQVLSDTPPPEPKPIQLRSLSVLLPQGTIDDADMNFSSYFLNLMKPDIEFPHICDCSSTVFSAAEDKPLLFSNFMKFVECFLISSLVRDTTGRGDQDSMTASTRIRAIFSNLRNEISTEVPSAFSTREERGGGDNEYRPPVISDPLHRVFKMGQTESGFFLWLNQYNIRAFGENMGDKAPFLHHNWNSRSWVKEMFRKMRDFSIDMKDKSPEWKHIVDTKEPLNPSKQLKSLDKLQSAYNEARSDFAKICQELRKSGSRGVADEIQYQFYNSIIDAFVEGPGTIMNPMQHFGERKGHEFLQYIFRIDLANLLLISVSKDIYRLGHEIANFPIHRAQNVANLWSDFSLDWEILSR